MDAEELHKKATVLFLYLENLVWGSGERRRKTEGQSVWLIPVVLHDVSVQNVSPKYIGR
jgi:hypothetical protein